MLTLVVGYLIGVFSVWYYWVFAAKFAPTEEIAVEILKKDGALMVTTLFDTSLSSVLFFDNVANNMDGNQGLPAK